MTLQNAIKKAIKSYKFFLDRNSDEYDKLEDQMKLTPEMIEIYNQIQRNLNETIEAMKSVETVKEFNKLQKKWQTKSDNLCIKFRDLQD